MEPPPKNEAEVPVPLFIQLGPNLRNIVEPANRRTRGYYFETSPVIHFEKAPAQAEPIARGRFDNNMYVRQSLFCEGRTGVMVRQQANWDTAKVTKIEFSFMCKVAYISDNTFGGPRNS